MRVAYQGEPGAYGEEAVLRMFGDVEAVQCGSFAGVFEAVARGDADHGVVPVENSMAGCINETYDLLLAHALVITGELELRVSHCLMALPGQTLGQITKVYSHPQALAQCDAYLKRLGAELVPHYNTAGSAKMIREQGLAGCAAVASRRAASIYALEVLADQIEAHPENYTRFLALGQTPVPQAERSKTSVVFHVRNEIGTLHPALGTLATRRINLVKIESRPARHRPWDYTFYVDVDGHAAVDPLREALEELRQHTTFLRVLGSYPKAPREAASA